MKKLDVFIQGETMDLCIPTEEFARESRWYSWFNSKYITKYLEQGLFPNTAEAQVDFFHSIERERLVLIISDKKEYVGVISLSFINLEKKISDIAIVHDSMMNVQMSPFVSLEAMARLTEFGFKNIGLNRIQAGQHVDLGGWRSWQQRLELLGYKLEGIHKNKFVKGHEISDSFSIACLYEDFLKIENHRGNLWDSMENMKQRFMKLPQQYFAAIMKDFIDDKKEDYYKKIFLL